MARAVQTGPSSTQEVRSRHRYTQCLAKIIAAYNAVVTAATRRMMSSARHLSLACALGTHPSVVCYFQPSPSLSGVQSHRTATLPGGGQADYVARRRPKAGATGPGFSSYPSAVGNLFSERARFEVFARCGERRQ
jgi:hypothetical protein